MTYHQWTTQTTNAKILQIKEQQANFWEHLLNVFYNFETLWEDVEQVNRYWLVCYDNVLPQLKVLEKLTLELDTLEIGNIAEISNTNTQDSNATMELKYRGYLVEEGGGNFEKNESTQKMTGEGKTLSKSKNTLETLYFALNTRINDMWGNIEYGFKKIFQTIYGVN